MHCRNRRAHELTAFTGRYINEQHLKLAAEFVLNARPMVGDNLVAVRASGGVKEYAIDNGLLCLA